MLDVPDDVEFAKKGVGSFEDYYKEHQNDKLTSGELYSRWFLECQPEVDPTHSFFTADISKEEYARIHANDTKKECEIYLDWLKECKPYDQYNVKYEEYLYDYAEEHDLLKYKPLFKYYSSPAIYISVSKDEFYQIAAYDDVKTVEYWEVVTALPDVVEEFFYDSGDALRILRASVGLERKFYSMSCDLNQDGSIDSTDALSALRSSVGLENVTQPQPGLTYPLYDVSKFGRVNLWNYANPGRYD